MCIACNNFKQDNRNANILQFIFIFIFIFNHRQTRNVNRLFDAFFLRYSLAKSSDSLDYLFLPFMQANKSQIE